MFETKQPYENKGETNILHIIYSGQSNFFNILKLV